jgi:hypothetical protein
MHLIANLCQNCEELQTGVLLNSLAFTEMSGTSKVKHTVIALLLRGNRIHKLSR